MFYQTDVLLQKLNVRQPAFSTKSDNETQKESLQWS